MPSGAQAEPAGHKPVRLVLEQELSLVIGVQLPLTQTSPAGHNPVTLLGEQALGGTGPTHSPSVQTSQAEQVPVGRSDEQVGVMGWQLPLVQSATGLQKPLEFSAEH